MKFDHCWEVPIQLATGLETLMEELIELEFWDHERVCFNEELHLTDNDKEDLNNGT